jgi:hypothetical protein
MIEFHRDIVASGGEYARHGRFLGVIASVFGQPQKAGAGEIDIRREI